MKFQFAIPSCRRVSSHLVLFVVVISACLMSINHLHSLVIQSTTDPATTSDKTHNDNGIDQYLGYLPTQLLRQVAGEYFPSTRTTTAAATDASTLVLSKPQPKPLSTSTTRSTSTTTTTNDNRRWAYAYLMAGVNAKHPGYRGILYNVLVSAEMLKNSRADIILMVQMAKNSPFDRLLPIEEEWLQAMNVTIKYLNLPDHGVQNFYTVQLEKFHVLEWTEYSRVLFMDGDVMPFCELDYLFELSDPPAGQEPLLKQNLIMAWTLEPAHGGFFMLAPHEGDFEQLEAIVQRREDEVLDTGILFDEKVGWGHEIEKRGWRAALVPRTNLFLWDWHGDFVDQGLLYYWTKYYKKDVSIVINQEVENWGSTQAPFISVESNANATAQAHATRSTEIFLERTLQDPFDQYSACVKGMYVSRPRRYSQVGTASRGEQWHAPYRDFIHFTGKFKPWLDRTQQELDLDGIINQTWINGTECLDALKSAQELWYYTFWKIHERLHMENSTFKSADHFSASTQQSTHNRTATEYWRDVATFAHLFKVNIRNLKIPKLALGGYPTYNMMKDVMAARTGRSMDHVEGWKEIEDRKKAKRKYKPF